MSAAEGAKPAYYDDLDAARGVLMALGVVIHAANVYGSYIPDVVGNADKGVFFLYLSDAIHVFRMPAFFLISGFFCAMSLRKYEAEKVLSGRAQRILVPFAAAVLLFNLPTLSLLASIGASGFKPPEGRALEIFTRYDWLLHLWFLPVLFILVAGAAALHRATRGRAAPAFLKTLKISPLLLAPALALSSYGPHLLGEVFKAAVYTPFIGGVNLFAIVSYAPYFIAGYYFFSAPEIVEELRRFSPAKAILFVVVIIAWPLELMNHIVPENFEVGFGALGSWLAIFALFPMFAALISRFKIDGRLVARPSYSVYLSHYLLVMALGALFASVGLPIAVEFALIVVAALVFTSAFHFFVVERSPVLSFLLNGRDMADIRRRQKGPKWRRSV